MIRQGCQSRLQASRGHPSWLSDGDDPSESKASRISKKKIVFVALCTFAWTPFICVLYVPPNWPNEGNCRHVCLNDCSDEVFTVCTPRMIRLHVKGGLQSNRLTASLQEYK
ncbi:hypothetical protein DUNSADRAFT_10545 [Dunaliella salina]|uniref:G-protein coupled receptors family 1 profile domain-containing protein n=1 Tax=Dunaliella salina TaxID=3046 RepID=A0ABQ7GF02_DUNSA|nr:hypothetical protein DUNSADRAFT_10545 [Dunaliella salina]|eukprot:KAF5833195.1 hypothetical protein DUNSADRAFT_10545 [Dunaliella salina]